VQACSFAIAHCVVLIHTLFCNTLLS